MKLDVNWVLCSLLFSDDVVHARQDLVGLQRPEAETRASRLNGRRDLGHVVADQTEAHVVRELFDDCAKTGK